ncbi:cellulose synthase catalytic subunit [Enterococcus gilvus]|uniref:glycosyltransferase family 2 protein n=1 Tax=Enterococcus gilvus TaxID=160453 RepID=UPI00290F7821|nr:cellulose synthase catalytic subunit [Enterococcus gilvus]MDU5510994.1 cellulose synthase catalytic subunit [Enterococcus gilvus]
MNRRGKIIVFFAILSQISYLIFRFRFTLPFRWGIVPLFFAALLLLSELSSNLQGIYEFITIALKKELKEITLKPEQYPDVDILITTHNEHRELLYKTINACKNLSYPETSKIHIYLCDDNHREEMKKIAAIFGIEYIGLRKEDNPDKKAGNVNNGLKRTASPLVACLDCDMIPRSNFLLEVVPYFYETENNSEEEIAAYSEELASSGYRYKIGYVQTPQDFYTLDLFQYNLFADNVLPNEQDYFFKHVNSARMPFNSAIYCGSNAVISRDALESTGGLSTDSITEDFSSSIKIQKAGYLGRVLSKSYVYGLCPFTIDDLRSQRVRWSRGFVQGVRSNRLLLSNLTLLSKFSYFILYNYWLLPFRKLAFLFIPIISVLFNLRIIDTDILVLLMVWLPSYFIYNWALSSVSEKSLNRTYSNLIDTILTPYIAWPLFKEIVGIREKTFTVTPKEFWRINEAPPKRYVLFNLVGLLLTVLSIVAIFINIYNIPIASQVFVLFWLFQNAVSFFYGISFNRPREGIGNEFIRWNIELQGTLVFESGADKKWEIETDYLNEEIVHLKTGEEVRSFIGKRGQLQISDGRYAANLKVSVHQSKDGGIELAIEETIDELNPSYNQYLHLLHDRETTYTTKIANKNFWIDNFDRNFINAFKIDWLKRRRTRRRLLPLLQIKGNAEKKGVE